ncbi:hypothetical protein [Sphingobacterium sp. UGAL515B_05]|uniref:hypothetical protein n=1 Tax=Sphingobacterium TaxID=28453 RepID=UPI00295356D5|nr:hypothetical protein [Sphingobacterium sp. UGAL515B_05]WON93785.1 hypothetical protein OK025_21365 [Sphingobacterium sp. UGAL515B_05]
MNTTKNQVVLVTRTVFTFDGVKSKDGAKSTETSHPTTGSTTNSTYIFNCPK